MHIQLVTFNLSGMTDAEYTQACEEQFGPVFAAIPGLSSKIWLRDAGTNTYGGVYAWRDVDAIRDFEASGVYKALLSDGRFVNITSRVFEVNEVPTRLTNGMFPSAAVA